MDNIFFRENVSPFSHLKLRPEIQALMNRNVTHTVTKRNKSILVGNDK